MNNGPSLLQSFYTLNLFHDRNSAVEDYLINYSNSLSYF